MHLNEPSIKPREFVRASYPAPVEFKVGLNDVFHGTLACDLSQGGLKCYVSNFIAVGTDVQLNIQFDQQEEILELQSKVKWIQEATNREGQYQIGLEFDEQTPGVMRKRIANHIFFE